MSGVGAEDPSMPEAEDDDLDGDSADGESTEMVSLRPYLNPDRGIVENLQALDTAARKANVEVDQRDFVNDFRGRLSDAAERNAPDENAPDENAPDANAPVANAPVANAPDANAPDANAPVANAPDANAPDANAPDANAPHANAPDNAIAGRLATVDVEALADAFEERVRTVIDGKGWRLWKNRLVKIGPIVTAAGSIALIVRTIKEAAEKAPDPSALSAVSPASAPLKPTADGLDPAVGRQIADAFLTTSDVDFWQSYVDMAGTLDIRLSALEYTVWMGMVIYLSSYAPRSPWTWPSAADKAGTVLTLVDAIDTGGMRKAFATLVDEVRTRHLPREPAAEVMGLALTKWWRDKQS